MESLGGIGFSNTSSAITRKKRSTTLCRPWNERQLQDASSLPSTPIPDIREAVESDEGSTNGSFQGSNQGHSTACTEGFLVPTIKKESSERRAGFAENTVKKVKLKVCGSSKVINATSASDGASDIGLCSTKSSHASLDNASKADSCNDTRDSKTNTYPIRKNNRISKRRVLDEELGGLDDDEDEEVQFLRRVQMGKIVSVEEDDEERNRKHRKLSKVMKRNVEYPRGVGTSEKSGKKDKTGKAFDDADYVKDEEEGLSDAEVELESKSGRDRRRECLSELKTEMTVTTRRRSGHSGNLIEFPRGLPPAPPRKRKEDGLEVDQQLKRVEAAQRRKLFKWKKQLESQRLRQSGRFWDKTLAGKKKEDKIKKQQEEKAKEKAADLIACRSDTVKWAMGPSGTIVIFPEELGLPSIFNSRPQSYPPPRRDVLVQNVPTHTNTEIHNQTFHCAASSATRR